MTIKEIVENLDLVVLCGDAHSDREVAGGECSDILSDIMAKGRKHSVWITHQISENVLAIAFFKELAAIIFPNQLKPNQDVIEKAREKNILLLTAAGTAFEVCGHLYALGLRGRD